MRMMLVEMVMAEEAAGVLVVVVVITVVVVLVIWKVCKKIFAGPVSKVPNCARTEGHLSPRCCSLASIHSNIPV